jgi:hypothetical protein
MASYRKVLILSIERQKDVQVVWKGAKLPEREQGNG